MFGLFDKIYGRSPKWRKVRAEHIKNNPECAACGRKDGLEVHHIVPYHINPDLELEPSNLITLCGKYCHFIFGHYMDWKSWNENVVRDSTLYYACKIKRPYKEPGFGSQEKGYSNAIINTITGSYNWLIKLFSWNN
jgi:5-methylcytosine-specific restriction protein A